MIEICMDKHAHLKSKVMRENQALFMMKELSKAIDQGLIANI